MKSYVRIAPSILSADFGRLHEQVQAAERAGADVIHVDVMDGCFVPNITIGPLVVKAVRKATSLPLDVHLMISEPERYLKAFANAGATILTVHPEATPHIHSALQQIRDLGILAGISLNPGTTAEQLPYLMPYLDLVLVMTVNPGFGGQKFIAEMLPKIAQVRAMLDAAESNAWLSVDGGINTVTAPQVVAAGATHLVAGSAVYGAPEGITGAIQGLRGSYQA